MAISIARNLRRWSGAASAAALLTAAPVAAVDWAVPLDFQREIRGNPVIQVEKGTEPTTARLFTDDITKSKNLREVYLLRLSRNEAVQLDLKSSKFDGYLEIYSEAGELLTEDDDAGGNTNARLFFANTANQAGRFYVVVSGVGDREGNFELQVRGRPGPGPDNAGTLSDGLTLAGTLTPSSPLRIKDQRVYKSFRFNASPGDRVRIRVKATAENAGNTDAPPVELELSHNGTVLDRAAPNSLDPRPAILRTLTQGGYHQVAVLGPPDASSSFEVSLVKLPPPRTAEAKPVTVGGTVQDAFALDSPVITGTSNRPYSLYMIEGRKGEQIALSARMLASAPESGRTVPLSIEVGDNTAAGFARVQPNFLPRDADGVRRNAVTFESDGRLLIRVAAPPGTVGAFKLWVEPAPANAASTTSD